MAGNYSLGEAKGTIRIDYDGRGVNEASTAVDSLGDRARNTQQRFSSLATTTGIAATAMAAGLGLAVNAAIDFEKQISAIGAVSGASAEQLEALRAKALQLGADTAFSASDAANAMEELVKAGLSVEDTLNGAADATVALAAAGSIELPEAATIAANAMNQFNLAAQDLPHVADLIAGAANASAIDVGEFGFAMQQAGAVANLVGVSFDDLATAIALMGNAGIKGSDAGTSLKTFLQNLQPTTEKQTELFKELGIITEDNTNRFYDQNGSLKDLSSVADVLNEALAGMTDQQKALALETLFGTDAIRAAAIIANEGSEGFDALAASIGEVSAADVAAARLDNTAGAIEQLKGSVETAAIALGTALLPVIRKVTEFVTELVNWFSALDPKWQKLIAFALVAVTALVAFVAVLAGIIAAVAGVIAAFAGAGEVLAIVVGIIAGIVALAAAIKLAYDRSAEFRDLLASLGQYFQAAFGFVMSIVTPIVDFIKNDLIPAVQEISKKLQENLAPAFKAIGEFIQQRVVPGIQKLQEAVSKVMPYIIDLGKFLLGVAKVIIDVLGKALGFLIPLLANILGPVFSFLIDIIAGVISFIPKIIEGFKTFINIAKEVGKIIAIAIIAPFYAIYVAGKWVFEQLMKVVNVFIDAFKAVWNFIAPVVQAVFGLIGAIIGLAFDIITALFQAWWTVVSAIWNVFWDNVIKPVMSAFSAIWNFLQAAFDVILAIVKVGWAVIVAIWDKIYDWIVTPIVTAFNFVADWIGKKIEEARAIIAFVWDLIVALFTAARDRIVAIVNGFTEFVSKIREHFNNAKEAALTKLQELIDWVKALPGKILDALGNIGSTLFNAGKALIQGFWDGMKAIWDDMTGWVEDGMSWLRGLWPFSPAKHGPFSGKGWVLYSGQALMEGFAEGMNDRQGLVRSTAERTLGFDLPVDHSSAVQAGQNFASGMPMSGSSSGPSSTSTATYGDVILNVSLDDLQTVRDLEELWEWIDALRNNSRRGLEVTAA